MVEHAIAFLDKRRVSALKSKSLCVRCVVKRSHTWCSCMNFLNQAGACCAAVAMLYLWQREASSTPWLEFFGPGFPGRARTFGMGGFSDPSDPMKSKGYCSRRTLVLVALYDVLITPEHLMKSCSG